MCKNTGQSFSKWIYDALDIAIGEHQQQQLVKWEHEEEYHSKNKKTDKYKQIRMRKREERSQETKKKGKPRRNSVKHRYWYGRSNITKKKKINSKYFRG